MSLADNNLLQAFLTTVVTFPLFQHPIPNLIRRRVLSPDVSFIIHSLLNSTPLEFGLGMGAGEPMYQKLNRLSFSINAFTVLHQRPRTGDLYRGPRNG